ncbi:MAG: HEAT repeat domain-containing protein [Planctomycetes bacterium]|nr:HEAT repeat domain-containing protein [Planctomycetota bacterium]
MSRPSSSVSRPRSLVCGALLVALLLPATAGARMQSVGADGPREGAAGTDPAGEVRGPGEADAGQPSLAEPAQDGSSGSARGQASGADDGPDPTPAVVEARAALLSGSQGDDELSIHAVTLINAGDFETLRATLGGTRRNAVLGVLSAFKVRYASELLAAVTDLAARTDDAEVRTRASDAMRDLVRTRADVLPALAARLGDPALPVAVRRIVVGLLGESYDLRAVPALLRELRGPAWAEADAALGELSRHERPAQSLPADFWPGFWEANAGLPLVQLIDRELLRQREEHAAEMARKNDEIVKTRISTMGNDVDRLMAEVTDEFQRVRLTAVQRLGQHPNKEQAANAVPLLLRCLGYGVERAASEGETNGPSNGNGTTGNGSAAEVPRETDDEVRTAIVTALGTLGRGRADVQDVLLQVVRNSEGPIASAAVDALAGERDQPQVVPPLLQYIGRSEVPSATLVNVLRIIAQNQPREVFAELAPWMSASYEPDVRAAAVEAVVADVDLGPALASTTSLTSPDQPSQVRFALARALGKRLRATVPPADDVRPRILELLADLADDIDKNVRAEAATSLGEMRSEGAQAVLEERSLRETDPSVVEKVIAALGTLRLDSAVPIIGRTCGRWVGGEPERLLSAAHQALSLLGDGLDAGAWLDMAATLREAGSPSLSVWACNEVVNRFAGVQAAREVVSRARGALAEGLYLEGRYQEAHDRLVELQEANAPYPNGNRRLELLALTSEKLSLWSEAAQHYSQLLELQGEGEVNRLATRRAYAVALMEAGRSEDALQEIEALFAEDAGDSDLVLRQGLLLERLGRLPEAEDVLLHLGESLPADDATIRARALEALGRVQAALAAVRGDGAAPAGDAGQPAGAGEGAGSDDDGPPSDPAASGDGATSEDNR